VDLIYEPEPKTRREAPSPVAAAPRSDPLDDQRAAEAAAEGKLYRPGIGQVLGVR
jgi:hypothetical protein